jgi:hypothetical protein
MTEGKYTELELWMFMQKMEKEVHGDDSYLFAGDQREEEDEIDFNLRKRGK